MELANYHALYHACYRQEEQRTHAYHYLQGLLNPEIVRKSAENIALATVGIEGVRPLQQFLGESPWCDQPLLTEHRRQVGLTLGSQDGVLILDGSDCPKQGSASVGVKRQYCGEVGKVANCQAGVYLGYSSGKGYTLLDRRLYLPEEWFTPAYAGKRYHSRVPVDLTFQTKNELAWAMVAETHQAGTLAATWVTMDEAFGKDSQLLDRIAQETAYAYFAEVPTDTHLWLTEPPTEVPVYSGRGRPPTKRQLTADAPAPQTVAQLAAALPSSAWSCHALHEGSKGFIVAHLARLRVVTIRDGLPGPACWLVLRRSTATPSEIRYFLTNAPGDCPLDTMAHICSRRWPIETMFEQAKQLLGLNEYETRTWFGWHHHMSLVILAFGFLARCQLLFKPDAPALTLPQIILLLKAVLPKPDFDPDYALHLLHYQQQRIARAKKSHYFKQKELLNELLFDTQ